MWRRPAILLLCLVGPATAAPLGVVYETDAAAEPKVKVVDRFPESMHPSIVYPAALVAASATPPSISSSSPPRRGRCSRRTASAC